jgi:transcriptional regulator with XRE-family HTH domain
MGSARKAEPNEALRRQRLQRGWTLDRVAEELDRLCEREGRHAGVTGNMVGKWERGIKKPSLFYQERLRSLYGVPAEQLGFLNPKPASPPSGPGVDRGGVAELVASGGDDMERRVFLRQLAAATGGAAIGSRLDGLPPEPWDRLSKALRKPALVDETTVADLEAVTAKHYKLEERVPARRLLGGVVEHLHTLTRFLEASQPAPLRRRLASTAGELAALAGWLSYELSCQAEARAYYNVAIEAAKEAGDRALWSCVLGYMSFMPSSADNPHDARQLLAQARDLARNSAGPTARSWLAGLEAEAQAKLGERGGSLAAVDRAEAAFAAAGHHDQPRCWIDFFDRGRLEGLKVSSYVNLRMPDDAERASRQALAALSPTATKKRSIVLADLAIAHLQRRELDESCRLASESLDIIAETESRVGLERIESLRRRIEPWRTSRPVRLLDERIAAARERKT